MGLRVPQVPQRLLLSAQILQRPNCCPKNRFNIKTLLRLIGSAMVAVFLLHRAPVRTWLVKLARRVGVFFGGKKPELLGLFSSRVCPVNCYLIEFRF
jgi:hypothetical protein